jgi:serine phosphatase RsbU (regulator of sigma subunit)
MAGAAHVEVRDLTGDRVVAIEQFPFSMGRRETNSLVLSGTEVSREHADISFDGTTYTLRDHASRYGTFVNDVPITRHALTPGDRIRLGRDGGAEMVFGVGDVSLNPSPRSLSTPVSEIRQMAALLEGLRALSLGRVLHDVLALVLDSAITLSGAERGFIMLASPEGVLEFKLARGKGKTPLGDAPFETSRKIPETAFTTGQIQVVTDLRRHDLVDEHAHTLALGIRHVLCAPLNVVPFVDAADASPDERRIGVLYLDSQQEAAFLSPTVRSALETLATEAAVAIENARLYREAAEKARMDREMRFAIELQDLLLPKAPVHKPFAEAAADSVPCRSIGGDFFDYADQESDRFAFTLGDVAGKGPSAALLAALLQGMFSLAMEGSAAPAAVVSRVNCALCRRAIEARFATLFYGVLDPYGRLVYCNGGHNPPFLFGPSGVRRLEAGGPVVGLLSGALYDEGTEQLAPGDRIVVFSDGVSEALSKTGEEFSDDRLLAVLESARATSANMDGTSLVKAITAAVRDFTQGAPQSDDITVMVVRYLGPR